MGVISHALLIAEESCESSARHSYDCRGLAYPIKAKHARRIM